MKTNLDIFKSNDEFEKDGVWFEVSDGVRFLVKRFGGSNASELKKSMAKHHKPYASLISKGLLPEEKERKIYTKVFTEACVIDWVGVEVDGELVDFNKEKAVELFTELPELLDTLVEYAQDVTNFSEDLGNS